MTYNLDALIQAADFNTTLRNPIQLLYGPGYSDRGYGQTAITIPTVTPPDATTGELQQMVASNEWTLLRSAMVVMGNHQGTTVTLPTAVDIGVDKLIKYYYGNVAAVANLDTNRLVPAADARTIYSNQTAPNDTYTGVWTTQLVHEFKMVFTTVDKARYFFNSGGTIRFTPSRTGGAVTQHNTFWTDLCSFYGTISMDAHQTRAVFHRALGVTGIGGSSGYYELPLWGGSWNGSNLLWKGIGDGSTYSFALFAGSGNNISIYGATEDGMTGTLGDRGKTLRFRIEFNDLNVTAPDTMDGTMLADVSINKATTYLTVDSPSAWTNVTALSGT